MNYELFRSIHGLAGDNPILDAIMVFFTQRAILIYTIFLLIMWFKNDKRIALYAGISGVLASLVNFSIALCYFEPRPFVTHHVNVLIHHAATASFPSEHTTGAFALAVSVLLQKHRLGYIMLTIAILTGISRVWVGHHYPLDVIASIFVGGGTSLLIYKISSYVDPFIGFVIQKYEKFLSKFKKKRPTKSKS